MVARSGPERIPDLPAGKAPFLVGGNESHGMAVTSDGKTLVVNSRLNSALYSYSLSDLKLLGSADVGQSPDWVTLTPDGNICGQRGVELSIRGRRPVHERTHPHSSRTGSEAKRHSAAAVASENSYRWASC
jgi:hypothetical protein